MGPLRAGARTGEALARFRRPRSAATFFPRRWSSREPVKMKVRDFQNYSKPSAIDPRSGHHIIPAVSGGAESRKPVGHGHAPHTVDAGVVGDTEPPPAPLPSFGAELEQVCATILPALRGLAAPNERERLTGVTCAVLGSELALSQLIMHQRNDEEQRERAGVAGIEGRIPLSSY